MEKLPELENILVAIADRKSLDIFCSIAEGIGESDKLKRERGLSRKQYYSRTGRMLRAGLIKRRRGCFLLSTLGVIVYQAQLEIDSGVKNYWKLKAIDSIEASHNMSQQERSKIIKTIINDEKIGNILEKRIEANKLQ